MALWQFRDWAAPAGAGTVQDASFVYGQGGNFNTRATPTSSASTIANPSGSAIDKINHRLFVADRYANRVLIFNLNANNTPSDDVADLVLGQTNFTNTGNNTSATGLYTPESVAYDEVNNRLWVSESDNNRVVGFNLASLSNGMTASWVLGQSGFTTGGYALSQSSLDGPRQIAIDSQNQRLYVAEAGNRRVSVFNVASPSNGMNAASVIGQSSFTTNGGSTSQSGLVDPYGVAFEKSSSRLYVSDRNNNRVLVYDTTNLTMGMNASFVLGQTLFTTANPNVNQNGFDKPYGLAVEGNKLWVTDNGNARVVGFDTTSLSNGMAAQIVIGQTSFGTKLMGTSSSKLDNAVNVSFDAGSQRLFVSDALNRHVLSFGVMDQSSGVTVSGTVNPVMTFTVTGRPSVCNGQSASNFQTGSTATAVGLGALNAAATSGAAQDLQVDTNAANGFVVFIRTSGVTPNAFNDGAGRSIADVAGTQASPGAAPVAGTPGFGYTSNDALTAFTANTFAKITNTNDSILIGNAGTASKSACVGYQAAIGSTTAAATYSVAIIYTAVPSF